MLGITKRFYAKLLFPFKSVGPAFWVVGDPGECLFWSLGSHFFVLPEGDDPPFPPPPPPYLQDSSYFNFFDFSSLYLLNKNRFTDFYLIHEFHSGY